MLWCVDYSNKAAFWLQHIRTWSNPSSNFSFSGRSWSWNCLLSILSSISIPNQTEFMNAWKRVLGLVWYLSEILLHGVCSMISLKFGSGTNLTLLYCVQFFPTEDFGRFLIPRQFKLLQKCVRSCCLRLKVFFLWRRDKGWKTDNIIKWIILYFL